MACNEIELRGNENYVTRIAVGTLIAERPPHRGLGADVDRYSFIAVDLHHLLLAGLPAHSLKFRGEPWLPSNCFQRGGRRTNSR
jgi:hypothetical protein